MSATDAVFEAEIRERMAGIAICAGCEEEWVPIADILEDAKPIYCAWCAAAKRVLDADFERRQKATALYAAQPREAVGVVPMAQVMRPVDWAPVTAFERVEYTAFYFVVGVVGAALALGGVWGVIYIALHIYAS